MPIAWLFRTSRPFDYHPGRIGTGVYFVYYDPWMRPKIDAETSKSSVATTRVVPDDVPIGWRMWRMIFGDPLGAANDIREAGSIINNDNGFGAGSRDVNNGVADIR